MAYHESVYVEKLSAFSALLREEGITAGMQETADACTILSVLPLDDRTTVRDALCAVYAKTREQQLAFYRAFDAYFVSTEQRQAAIQHQKEEAEQLSRLRSQAEEDFQVNGQPLDIREDLQEVYLHMSEEKREELRQLAERSKMNIDRSPKLYTNFIRSVFMRFLLEQQMLLEDAAVGVAEADPDVGLLYRDISRFKDTDIPRASALIATIARQLNAELSQKRRRGGHSGKLDFKRTIRRGLETGGSFYRLSYRHKRKKRRQLIVLCDVSGSMLQFSEFALRFLKSMSEVSENIRIFLFSEELREVDPFALQNMDAFRKYVGSCGLYGRGTDVGRALDDLCHLKNSPLTQGSTLLLLSDTKTIDIPHALRALDNAQRKAGKVMWLNPIPESKWPYIRSIQIFSAVCQMLPCSTLEELSRACKRLLKN